MLEEGDDVDVRLSDAACVGVAVRVSPADTVSEGDREGESESDDDIVPVGERVWLEV